MAKLTRVFPLLALIVGVVLPVLPAEGATITSGTATELAIEKAPGQAGVTVIGKQAFTAGTSDDPFSPCRDPAVILAVINSQPDLLGSDVFGANDGLVLPLDHLRSNPGQTCLYEETFDPPGPLGPTKVTLKLGRNGGVFNFNLQYRYGTYVTGFPAPFTQTTPCAATAMNPDPLRLWFDVRLISVTRPPSPPITIRDNVVWELRDDSPPCNSLKFPW
jgi:hypothetical protein